MLVSLSIVSSLFSLVSAHASLNPSVSTGSYSQTNLRVPHGCNGSDTLSVQVSIPANLSSVKPQKVAGWTITISKRPLAVPITSESGAAITDEVDSITWAQGSLPDTEYQDFGITFKAPPSPDGTVFYFPVVQSCVSGFFNNWTQIPTGDGKKLSFPAPTFTIMANGTLLKASSVSASAAGAKNGATSLASQRNALAAAIVGAFVF